MDDKVVLLGKVVELRGDHVPERFVGTTSYAVERNRFGIKRYEFGAIGHTCKNLSDTPLLLLREVTVKGAKKSKIKDAYSLDVLRKETSPLAVACALTDSGLVGILSPNIDFDQCEHMEIGQAQRGVAQLLAQTKEGEPFYQDVIITDVREKTDSYYSISGVGISNITMAHGMSGSPLKQNGKFVGILSHRSDADKSIFHAIPAEDLLGQHDFAMNHSIEILKKEEADGTLRHGIKEALNFLKKATNAETFNQLLRTYDRLYPPPSLKELLVFCAQQQQEFNRYAELGMLKR